MFDISPEMVVVVMLGGLLLLVMSGFPLAYVVGILGVIVGFIVYGEGVTQIFYLRTYRLMMNYVLLAVPLFVFMGSMLERSGIIERLYDSLYLWMGGFRGGLAPSWWAQLWRLRWASSPPR